MPPTPSTVKVTPTKTSKEDVLSKLSPTVTPFYDTEQGYSASTPLPVNITPPKTLEEDVPPSETRVVPNVKQNEAASAVLPPKAPLAKTGTLVSDSKSYISKLKAFTTRWGIAGKSRSTAASQAGSANESSRAPSVAEEPARGGGGRDANDEKDKFAPIAAANGEDQVETKTTDAVGWLVVASKKKNFDRQEVREPVADLIAMSNSSKPPQIARNATTSTKSSKEVSTREKPACVDAKRSDSSSVEGEIKSETKQAFPLKLLGYEDPTPPVSSPKPTFTEAEIMGAKNGLARLKNPTFRVDEVTYANMYYNLVAKAYPITGTRTLGGNLDDETKAMVISHNTFNLENLPYEHIEKPESHKRGQYIDGFYDACTIKWVPEPIFNDNAMAYRGQRLGGKDYRWRLHELPCGYGHSANLIKSSLILGESSRPCTLLSYSFPQRVEAGQT